MRPMGERSLGCRYHISCRGTNFMCGRVFLSGGLGMKRSVLLGVLLVVGSLSIAVRAGTDVTRSSWQAAPAQGPRIVDIVKLKDNLYVLTSSTPGNPATFSGGNV